MARPRPLQHQDSDGMLLHFYKDPSEPCAGGRACPGSVSCNGTLWYHFGSASNTFFGVQAAGQESPKKPAAAVVAAASEGAGDDFFDSISCEAIERLELNETGQNPRLRLSEQRKVHSLPCHPGLARPAKHDIQFCTTWRFLLQSRLALPIHRTLIFESWAKAPVCVSLSNARFAACLAHLV